MELDFIQLGPVVREDEEGISLNQIQTLLIGSIGKFAFLAQRGQAGIIGKGQVTNAFGGTGHEDISKQAVCIAVVDLQVFATIFVFSGGHAFDVNEEVVRSLPGAR